MRFPWQKKGKLLPEKLALLEDVFSGGMATSFADLGGVWGVEGGYTFHVLDRYQITDAVLVDTHPTSLVRKRAGAYPSLRLVQGNFGSTTAMAEVGRVDVVLLFDVLLHQVAPDWDEVVRSYASNANCMVVYNQQWVGSENTVRLLDLGRDEYFRNVPHNPRDQPYDKLFERLDEPHPDHGRPWRDVHHIWQWGITDRDLISVTEAAGLRLVQQKNYGRFGRLNNFENHGFIFRR
jgi:hypothetical protein